MQIEEVGLIFKKLGTKRAGCLSYFPSNLKETFIFAR